MAQNDDDIWQIAWQWAQYPIHDVPDEHPDIARLNVWLDADPKHKKAYEQACHLWLMTGLVPPTETSSD